MIATARQQNVSGLPPLWRLYLEHIRRLVGLAIDGRTFFA
jgi:hypothetical protein